MNHPPPATDRLPEPIRTALAAFDRRRRLLRLLRGGAEMVCVFAAALVLAALVEAVWRPRAGARRWISGAGFVLVAGWGVGRALLPALRRSTLRRTAGLLERAAEGRFGERVLAAVEFCTVEPAPGVSGWMVEEGVRRTAESLRGLDAAALADGRPARRAVRAALGASLVLLACLASPELRARFLLALIPGGSGAALSAANLVVKPGDAQVREAMPLEIRVTASAPIEQPRLAIRWSDGFREQLALAPAGSNEFSLRLPSVRQNFQYEVLTGEARTRTYQVSVDAAPRVARVRTIITPPAQAPGRARTVEGGAADFITGSTVRLEVEAATNATAVHWLPEQADPTTLAWSAGRFVLELRPTNEIRYRLQAAAANGATSAPTQPWLLRPVNDLPPEAKLMAAGADTGLTSPEEILRLDATATDDIALRRVDLVAIGKQGDAASQTLYEAPAAPGSGAPEYKASLNRALADLGAFAGDQVQFELVAVDSAGQTNRSEPVTVTFGAAATIGEERAAERVRQWILALDAQGAALREARATWQWAARGEGGEGPAARSSALDLLEGRLDSFASEVARLGAQLTADGETNGLSEGRYMGRLGGSVAAWAGQERAVLQESIQAARKEATTSLSTELARAGKDRFDRALIDLAARRRSAAVLADSLAADVAVVRCDGAQGRYRRGLAVLRAETGPVALASSGLEVTFYEGVHLDGRILEQAAANPRFNDLAPGGRRENWSACYDGQINLPSAGVWTLGCAADDGVRLFVDDQSLLRTDAWGAHPATTFSGEKTLSAGWHNIRIEFFQGYGVSSLQVLAALKGEALKEVPASWFRPRPVQLARPVGPADPTLAPLAKAAVGERVRGSLALPASAPEVFATMTNDVPAEALAQLVEMKRPVGAGLSASVAKFASWTGDESRAAEAKADDLTAMAREARRLVREELERERWRHEGSFALQKVQTALAELRQLDLELRQEPYHPDTQRTEADRAKLELAAAWQRRLQAAATEAAHDYFEQAKRGDATLDERVKAVAAAAMAADQLGPAAEHVASAMSEAPQAETLANRLEHKIQDAQDQYRRLNELQESIDRAHVASEARRALPAARSFARRQASGASNDLAAPFESLREHARKLEQSQRLAADYDGASHLESLVGAAPETTKGADTAAEIRRLAQMANEQPPSLAASIPPPIRKEEESLAKKTADQADAAAKLALPRLAMSLESSRLARQHDRKAAVAYDLLGRDLGALIDKPEGLDPASLEPIATRAAALAGERGEEAKQAELRAAEAREQQLAQSEPADPSALASRLEELASDAEKASGQQPMREPLHRALAETSKLAPPAADWAEASDPKEVAAGAAAESLEAIQAAPKRGESFHQASEILGEAARQIRSENTQKELAGVNPYPSPEPPSQDGPPKKQKGPKPDEANLTGPAGRAAAGAKPQLGERDWARLNDLLRRGVRGSGVEAFNEEQQAAIRAYFQRLSANP